MLRVANIGMFETGISGNFEMEGDIQMTRKPYVRQGGKSPRRGFQAMSNLISGTVRKSGESRGFAIMRLLTHWDDIVGSDIAGMAQPVNVGYSRNGFGATLTILCKGVHAPIVQTMAPQIREKVNALYGYSAISRVAITQTAPAGFHEGQAAFLRAEPARAREIPPEVQTASKAVSEGVEDQGLRSALEALAQNVLARQAQK